MMSTVTALALIAAGHCVPPAVAPIMVGVGQHESGLQPYAVHDNTSGRSYFPDTAMQAVTISRSLLAIGHNLDLGIVQVNTSNFHWTSLSVETAFDACANFAAGAKVLFAKYNGNPPDSVKSRYAAGVIGAIAAPLAVAATPAPADPACVSWDVWSDCHVCRSWDVWADCSQPQQETAHSEQ